MDNSSTPTDRRELIPTAAHWGHFHVEVESGEVVRIHPSPDDPDPSPILDSIPNTLRHKTRIDAPMIREGYLQQGPGGGGNRGSEAFVRVSWETALDLLAKELRRVCDEHGNEAIYAGSYGWASAGRFHHAQSQVHRFLNLLGGYTYSVDTYSTAALTVLLPYVLGKKEYIWHRCTEWNNVADHANTVMMLGGVPPKNGQVNPGGTGRHIVAEALDRARARGVQFINVSPMRDDAARSLDARWHALRPNTDAALLLALCHCVIESGDHDREFLDTYCVGFETFATYLRGEVDGQPKTAEWAAEITGLSVTDIRELAATLATGRTFIMLSWSVQRGHHGEQPYWAAIALAAMLGQIGLPGGGIGFGYGSVGGIGNPTLDLPLPTFPQGSNAVSTYIPVARVTDMLCSPGDTVDYNGKTLTYPDIKLVYWCGGNPFHHHQDLNRFVDAWRRPETIVIQDPWWTPAARFADIVLPATTTLERNDIGVARLDPYMTVMRQAIPPVDEARNDFEIFRGLSSRLGLEDRFTEGRDEIGWLRHMYEVSRQQLAAHDVKVPGFDDFWEAGGLRFPDPDETHVLFEVFRADPHASPLTTPTGKIEIFSETIDSYGYTDCPGHPVWLEPCEWLGSTLAERFPLHMISNQPRTRLHSQLDPGATSANSKIEGREPARMNPDDAAARGIRDGDIIKLFNERGACLAGVSLTPDMRPGVVELSTGAWYDPLDPSVSGSLCVHGNPNVLTPDIGTSKLAQGPSAHTTLVEVERFEGRLPPIKVFSPPVIK